MIITLLIIIAACLMFGGQKVWRFITGLVTVCIWLVIAAIVIGAVIWLLTEYGRWIVAVGAIWLGTYIAWILYSDLKEYLEDRK